MIVVIGAGLAGLAAAWRLHADGHPTVVVDAGHRRGGPAGAHTVAGIRVDLGRHALDPAMPQELRSVLDGLVEIEERRSRRRILVDGRWTASPPTTGGVARTLPFEITARLARDRLLAPLRRPRGDSHAAAARATNGPTWWRHVDEPLAWKRWGIDPEQLAGRTGLADTPGPIVVHPRHGFAAIAEALAGDLPDVRLRTKVTGLLEHDDRVIVGLADGRILTASHVLSTVPATRTARWLGLLDGVEDGPTRAVVLVYLVLDRRPYTTFDTHVLPPRHLLPARVSEPTQLRDSAADPPDRTVLCAEVPCDEGDAIWRASDDDIGGRVADDLVRAGLPDPAATLADVVRIAVAARVPTRAALESTARALRSLARSRRVTDGREGAGFVADDTRELEAGLAAAAKVSAAVRAARGPGAG